MSLSAATNLLAQCHPSALPSPTVFGAQVLSISASPVTNFTATFGGPNAFNADPPLFGTADNLSFCNITVTYTHPGTNDNINVFLWLPLSASKAVLSNHTIPIPTQGANNTGPEWNGRFMTLGGGSWATCLQDSLQLPQLALGYALAKTDGGHSATNSVPIDPWALASPGNVNLNNMRNFGSIALHDTAVISKSIIQSFYGVPPKYSYFHGCSTGGRQALELAQRYPTDFDGILAAAPAIHFPQLFHNNYWPQVIMNKLNAFPQACEYEEITNRAIAACDALDGVKDGIVAAVDQCRFDPRQIVGTPIQCQVRSVDANGKTQVTNKTIPLSSAAAEIALATWTGPVDTNNVPLAFGLGRASILTPFTGASCTQDGKCVGVPDTNARSQDYRPGPRKTRDCCRNAKLFAESAEVYHDYLDSSDPKLQPFKQNGGKLLVWHGLSDEAIPTTQTVDYYNKVVQAFVSPGTSLGKAKAAVNDFYRLFLAPGVNHCGISASGGGLPLNSLNKLAAWVEQGIAPDQLDSKTFGRADGKQISRGICMYPLVQRYKGHGADVTKASSFECAPSF